MKRSFSFISSLEAWLRGHASIANALIAIVLTMVSCSSKDKNAPPENALIGIGNKYLTETELKLLLPGGLSSEDSIKFSQAIINAWIENELMAQIASKEIDMEAIDNMVAQYRNELIAHEYLNRMYQSHATLEIPEDSLLAYYKSHQQEFKLARPMVKGVYLKVADDASSLPKLRKLYRSQKENDIDNLDKSELSGAVHYDYFRDKWIDWEQIENRIPYDFGASADQFLKSNKNIDFSQGGFTYLLDITDVVYSGQIRPFESALPQIKERIEFYNRLKYGEELKNNLKQKAKENGKIRIFCDFDI